MTSLRQAVEEYLAMQRVLGFQLHHHGPALRDFVAFLARAGSPTITTRAALVWATQPVSIQPVHVAHRLGFVRRFARYRSAADPQTEIPPTDALPRGMGRRAPYLFTRPDVRRLLAAATAHDRGRRAAPYETVLGLLAVTGLRVSEALALERADVDLVAGVLRIRRTKFGKSRLVPLHASTQRALRCYARRRDRGHPRAPTARFFLSERGTRLTYDALWATFRRLAAAIALRPREARNGPRLHDFRHTFAVRTLVGWYRAGRDVDALLPRLSTYLGHTHVAHTYWYLSATPTLLRLAAARVAQAREDRR